MVGGNFLENTDWKGKKSEWVGKYKKWQEKKYPLELEKEWIGG